MTGDHKQFSGHDDLSVQNMLGSHVVLLTACLREFINETHASRVESIKNDLSLMTTVENLKKDTNAMKADLVHTHTDVENVKKELNELKASGAASSIGRMPKSCDDLQKIGYWKSGLFSVMDNKTVDNVYCDFTKPTNDAGFQKLIGYVDVKTSPVYFYAQKTSNSVKRNAAIPFDLLRFNVGNAMNTSGIFVARTSGKYFFSFSGLSSRSVLLGRVELQQRIG
ncbi:hypothetical protein DAPPUDRAFT_115861 [Daphnia pulex]|uniref:C1q domain-containing protein n=1 Tax=Daphnia pulex TaxID=6669 RepID=E9HMQ0_DAPPU|nr:hypothetical protein DAPPUDRAFT_115861 [Daphnia pulex]|eukprot:EFX66961.1 hypothetical protein DAPPUDRAFT_115861 [Daphnia pulex]